ncbi:polysaccharide biosynthesis/export family protein [Desulfoluna spongiiphila]|uniref:polysaccharide biosynthesis/export family protein n=1 Tax=Desulfoluna spongiiphila TaxID=419481 RepID=UPI001254CC79|nr:polysaccharide biosynthesis/export family protein [Desulfoluna spongiiphila]VVS92363.1 polysaccharide export protein [Desulfoluna spongiiphila]
MRRYLSCLICAVTLLGYAPATFADFSLTEAAAGKPIQDEVVEQASSLGMKVFGWNLFRGNFRKIREPWYNPSYRIHIGDIVNVKIWGAVELALDVPVDSQGNLFLPKVGNVSVLGVKNEDLIATIEKSVSRVYSSKVRVYANVANYQPITVFVAGNVNKPGLYQGMPSDSVLQFLDKANGINPECGSYRDIEIIRENRVIQKVDLYAFLIEGTLELFQFKSGDVISVKDVKNRVTVTGDVKRSYLFEFPKKSVKLSDILDLALLNPTATNVTVTRWGRDNKKVMTTFPVWQSEEVIVQGGDTVDVYPDHVSMLNTITITGEHDGMHSLLVGRDETLGDLLEKLQFTSRSEITAIQLFRKSVADKQKNLLEAKLQKLEELILTTPSVTKEESLMRSHETKGLLTFIDRARKVEPKGQVVINKKTNLDDIFLEDGDSIHIPAKSNLVLIQGEVSFPGAHTYVAEMTARDYIDLAGSLTARADTENILVLHQNGRVVKCDSEKMLKKMAVKTGDSVLVLPKMDGKKLQIAKDLTQIMYQVAVSAGVLLAL